MTGSSPRRLVPDPAGPRRRGVSLMVAIVLIAVASALLLAAARTVAMQRRSLETNRAAVQADLLADAALRRPAPDGPDASEPWAPDLPGGKAAVAVDDGRLTVTVNLGGVTAQAARPLADDPDDSNTEQERTNDDAN
ncbi:MAG: hypothetical protein AAF907_07235 [Planctomycetota bacterium]